MNNFHILATRKLPRLNDRKRVNINSIWPLLRSSNPGALAQPECKSSSCPTPQLQSL